MIYQCRENICVIYGCITCQLKKKKLWPIGKDRIEGGTSKRQKGFWESARWDIHTGRCDETWYLSTDNQSRAKKWIRINRLF